MYSRFVPVLFLFFLSLGFVSALPSPDFAVRQAVSGTISATVASPTSATISNSTQSSNVTMTMACMTSSGQQTQNCTTTMGGSPTSTMHPSATASPMVAAAFVMPGTTLQVLPVGLVVFGGITAIAIFVVAFVTWERVQYRRAFRKQRMDEVNSGLMGYGSGGAAKV